MIVKTIKQNEVSSECWSIQLLGLKACENCEFKNKKECGERNILKKLENEKGFKIPLKDYA